MKIFKAIVNDGDRNLETVEIAANADDVRYKLGADYDVLEIEDVTEDQLEDFDERYLKEVLDGGYDPILAEYFFALIMEHIND